MKQRIIDLREGDWLRHKVSVRRIVDVKAVQP
jgi:hypothetical protein